MTLEPIHMVLALCAVAGLSVGAVWSLTRKLEVHGLQEAVGGAACFVLAGVILAIASVDPSLGWTTGLGWLVALAGAGLWVNGIGKVTGVVALHVERPGAVRAAVLATVLAVIMAGDLEATALVGSVAGAAALGACVYAVHKSTDPLTGRRGAIALLGTGVGLFTLAAVSAVMLMADGAAEWHVLTGAAAATVATQFGLVALALLAAERAYCDLRRQANTDAVSGLLVRGEFMRRAQAEAGRCQREGVPLSCLAIDVDLLKQINDTEGHDEGDRAIATVGERIRQATRAYDVAGRVGGDEFVVLLPGVSAQIANAIGIRLSQDVLTSTQPRGHSVSIGISSGGQQMAVEDLMKRADRALYVAKRRGRGHVVTFDELSAIEATRGEPDSGPEVARESLV